MPSSSCNDNDDEESRCKDRCEHRRKKKHKRRKRRRSHSSDSSDSTTGEPHRRRKKDSKRSKKRKSKKSKAERRASKVEEVAERTTTANRSTSAQGDTKGTDTNTKPVPTTEEDQRREERRRAMIPMSQQQYEAVRSQIREVYDPESGRHRLVRGDGEIIERIVSRDQHQEINRTATQSDGTSFIRQVRDRARF